MKINPKTRSQIKPHQNRLSSAMILDRRIIQDQGIIGLLKVRNLQVCGTKFSKKKNNNIDLPNQPPKAFNHQKKEEKDQMISLLHPSLDLNLMSKGDIDQNRQITNKSTCSILEFPLLIEVKYDKHITEKALVNRVVLFL